MRRARRVLGIVAGAALGACSTVLGLQDYAVGPVARDAGDAGPDATVDAATDALPDAGAHVEDGATGCDGGDSSCYFCAPSTPSQLLNACTSAECVPFDDTTRLTHLLPDGALPPLPLPLPRSEAGTD